MSGIYITDKIAAQTNKADRDFLSDLFDVSMERFTCKNFELVETLFGNLLMAYSQKPVFNLNYLKDLMDLYITYDERNPIGMIDDKIVLALFLHKYKNSFQECVYFAANMCFYFGMKEEYVNTIVDYIKQTNEIELDTYVFEEQNIIHDLMLSRVGYPKMEFISNQQAIKRAHFGKYVLMTENYDEEEFRAKFNAIQLNIFKRINEQEINGEKSIFALKFFKERFETQARENIRFYTKYLNKGLLKTYEYKEQQEKIGASGDDYGGEQYYTHSGD